MSSLDAKLIEQYTQGINAPVVSQAGFIAVAAVSVVGGASIPNLSYVDPGLVFLGPKLGSDLADANATLVVGDGNARIIPAATLTANRQLTLGTTGATTGELLRVLRRGTEAFTVAVVNGGAGAGTKYTFPVSVARAAEFLFDGTNWNLSRHWAI